MCKWGTDKEVTLVRKVFVDECIADFVVWLNEQGVYTTGCCCGHLSGEPASFNLLPSSQARARELGFFPALNDVGNPEMYVTHEEIAARSTRV